MALTQAVRGLRLGCSSRRLRSLLLPMQPRARLTCHQVPSQAAHSSTAVPLLRRYQRARLHHLLLSVFLGPSQLALPIQACQARSCVFRGGGPSTARARSYEFRPPARIPTGRWRRSLGAHLSGFLEVLVLLIQELELPCESRKTTIAGGLDNAQIGLLKSACSQCF